MIRVQEHCLTMAKVVYEKGGNGTMDRISEIFGEKVYEKEYKNKDNKKDQEKGSQ